MINNETILNSTNWSFNFQDKWSPCFQQMWIRKCFEQTSVNQMVADGLKTL